MRETHNPFVSVIIPVYNDPKRLKICLQALEEQTYPKSSYEVIVVDNGSDESTEPVVAQCSQAKASCETHRGSYAARNKGLTLAIGEIIAFTDSDCIPAPDWIEKGVTNLLRIPNCGIVGGNVEIFFKNPDNPTAVELYDKIMHLNQKTYIERYKFSATANLFTFGQVFEHVGCFDGNLKSSGDYEWGQRVASFGYALVYAEDVQVVHPARYSFDQLRQKVKRVARGVEKMSRNNRMAFPKLGWNWERIRDYLPPVVTVMCLGRSQKVTAREQIKIIFLWFVLKYVKIKEKWRIKNTSR